MNNQKQILQYLNTVDTATLTDIYENTKLNYFHNWKKHTGAVMSRLVNQQLVNRLKPGVFEINESYVSKKKAQETQQEKLF